MRKHCTIFAICLGLIATSCSDSAAPEPIIQDVGTKILSGNSEPSSSSGKEGDFYINLQTQTLYGPKQGSSWGTGIVLSGSDGAPGSDGQNGNDGAPGRDGVDGSNGQDGKDGNSILNGQGAPAESLGNIGDFYFDTENLAIYGAKLSSGWGTPVSLKPQAASNGVRILIKEIIGPELAGDLSVSENEDGTFNVRADFKPILVNVGDISSYMNQGLVLYHVQILDDIWRSRDASSGFTASRYRFDVTLEWEEKMTYEFQAFQFPAHYALLSNHQGSRAEAIAEMESLLPGTKFAYRFTLIPSSAVDYLSKQYPNNQVDAKFVAKYFSLGR